MGQTLLPRVFPERTKTLWSVRVWLARLRYGRLKSELANVEELLKGKLQFVCANHVGEVSRATKRPSSGEAIPQRKKSRVETSEGAVMVNAR